MCVFVWVQVQCLLVNIFGGIVNCETIANGIIKACQDLELTLPLIVRLEGVFMCTIDSSFLVRMQYFS